MKNQYFGDQRDLFKYDLIFNILEGMGSLHQLAYIPMLTENDYSEDGNKRVFCDVESQNLPGARNENLVAFLKPFRDIGADERDFRCIESYFNSMGHKISIYNGLKGLYFEEMTRKEYFNKIPQKLLTNSLIFIDPDTGLEIKKSKEKHLLYSEVKSLYNHMDQDSIMMIFQYIAPTNRPTYISERYNRLKKITGNLPRYVSDNEIIFFVLAKSVSVENSLKQILVEYENKYEKLKEFKNRYKIT